MEVDLDDAEGGIRIGLNVLDVIHRRRQRALEWGDDAPGHLIGRQALVLKGHADDGDIDAWKDIDRHPQRCERAKQKDEQRRHYEGVRPAQGDADYGEHVDTWERPGPLGCMGRDFGCVASADNCRNGLGDFI